MFLVDFLRRKTWSRLLQGDFDHFDVGVIDPGSSMIIKQDVSGCRRGHAPGTSDHKFDLEKPSRILIQSPAQESTQAERTEKSCVNECGKSIVF